MVVKGPPSRSRAIEKEPSRTVEKVVRAPLPPLPKNTPSKDDGIEQNVEEQLRGFGVDLIQRSGILLRVPQMTLVSAAVIFQRFFYRKSFADCDVRIAACAALTLACKLEEQPRRLQDMLIVFHRVQMRELEEDGRATYASKPAPFLDPGTREYTDIKTETLRAERHILRELGFDGIMMFLDHSHKHALRYINSLNRPRKLAQKAWNYLNDSLRTTLCCRYRPQQIATASIFLAARSLGLKMPATPRPWYEVIDADAEGMEHIARIMLGLYGKPRLEYVYIARMKREPKASPLAATPGDGDCPNTPAMPAFSPPAGSPSDDEDVAANVAGGAANLNRMDTMQADPDRIADMLADGGGASANLSTTAAAPLTRAASGSGSGGSSAKVRENQKDHDRCRDFDREQQHNNVQRDPVQQRDNRERGNQKDKEPERRREREKDYANKRRRKHGRSASDDGSSSSGGQHRQRSRSASLSRSRKGSKAPPRGRGRERGRSESSTASSTSSRESTRGKQPNKRKRKVDADEVERKFQANV